MTSSRSHFNSKRSSKALKGSAITETAVGLFVLMPIFLILVDIIALVIGQTINDDIAKNAARYAAQGSNATSAQTLAETYMSGCAYTGPSGLVTGAHIVGIVNWTNSTTKVITEVTINLPIAVPLLNIKQQVMQSQFTETSIGVPATVPGS
jgi:hypothetical protein